MPQVFYHVTPLANVKQIMQTGLTPQIGPRAKLAQEPAPGIWMLRDKSALEDAVLNWLGDAFSDDEILTSLTITLPDDFPVEPSAAEYEAVVTRPIPPEYISRFAKIL